MAPLFSLTKDHKTMTLEYKDADWVRQSFMVDVDKVGNISLEKVDNENRFFSTAQLKFVDTTLGGNFAINPPPQFTSTADIKSPSKLVSGATISKGMGRYYSEAIDDNAQIIHMRFGVPQFNSLTTFFTGFYNSGAGHLARTGRSSGAFYQLGRAGAFVVSIMSWQLLAVHLIGTALKFALQKPSSKFYYLKPTMPLYWNAVTTIVNQLAVNSGVLPRIGGKDQDVFHPGYEFGAEGLQKMHKLLPDIFREEGGIDVYAVANRAQRLERQRLKAMRDAMEKFSNTDLKKRTEALAAAVQGVMDRHLVDERPDYHKYLEKWFAATPSQVKAQDAKSPDIGADNFDQSPEKNVGFGEFLDAELDEGGAFVSFRVNSTGHTGESFSNSAQESALANKINGMSASSRSSNFDFANGNIGEFGGAGILAGKLVNAAKSVVSGAADYFEVSGLAALGGAAFVDIPKGWHQASASLPRGSYTVNLVSPYGNPLSQLMNLHVPLAMLLAGVLPLSTGKQSYTSPFLVELYDRGRCQTRLGMIDSMSITRGVGNLGFNNAGKTMGIDVSFSILDLSSIMHMPISQGFSMGDFALAGAAAGALVATAAGGSGTTGAAVGQTIATAPSTIAKVINGVFDDDNAFTDYLAVVAGMGLADQIYVTKKFKLNLTRTMADFRSWNSPSHFASITGDTLPARIASMLYTGTARK